MTISLRTRIFLTLAPLLLLLLVLGGAGVVLLYRLGNSARAILRENYDSVLAMERLNEALERIDSSFQFTPQGQQDKAREQYKNNWVAYHDNLRVEQRNVTLPGERELVERLTALSQRYQARGDAYFSRAQTAADHQRAYFDPDGLLALFNEIKGVSAAIQRLNHDNMEEASEVAHQLALSSLKWFAAGLLAAAVLALLAAWHTVRTTLHPIQAMTEAAQAISAGRLDQIVSGTGSDELGQLATAFNTMTHKLRDYRQSQSARLLRAQRTSQATIDSFPDPVLVVDDAGHVEMANPAARRLIGVTPRLEEQRVGGVWHPPEPLRQPLDEALRGERDYLPEGFDRAILLGSGGGERAFLPRILTIRDPYGVTLGAAVLLQEVTRLRLLDQVKSNLVATASHELRTPLTSVRLALHLLLEESLGPLTPKQMELLIDARENSERLLAMVNNLLDLARLEQGWSQLEFRPEQPKALLEAAAEAVRARAEDKGVEVVLDVPPGLPEVAADVSRLDSALGNLLDNALAYTDRGGKVTLAARAADGTVTLSVADTGVGIPPEYLPHVFEKFFRVPGQSRGSGTGLGLAIVHEIVLAHGGNITCESRTGAGTVFRLTLPVANGGSGIPDSIR
jgi:signal transduction histidine kinase/HAMP domain-containing protein